jgi:hypothetical protein
MQAQAQTQTQTQAQAQTHAGTSASGTDGSVHGSPPRGLGYCP